MLSGIILAAGKSSRLGRPKQLLEFQGRPILQHVIDSAAASLLDEVILVLGHEADLIERALQMPAKSKIVVNTRFDEGQATSLQGGLGSVDPSSDAVTILLGDQPLLPASSIDRIIAEFRASGSPITRAVWSGTPGHPVVVARSAWPLLRVIEGDKGAREVISSSPDTKEVEMGEPAPQDVDTWEQYQELVGTQDAPPPLSPSMKG